MELSGFLSTSGIPWKSLKSALRNAIRVASLDCSLIRLKIFLKKLKYWGLEKSEILPLLMLFGHLRECRLIKLDYASKKTAISAT